MENNQNISAEQKEQNSVVYSQPDEMTFTVNGVSFTMVRVEGGTFQMGATPEQGKDADPDEYPAHQVTLDSYAIGQTQVTQALWQAVMGENPSRFKGNTLPVECISWNDCQGFIKKLNFLTGLIGQTFRLPTEAEWEYAARGGRKSHDYKYSGSNNLDEVAWYDDNADDNTHPVATKKLNELGLYDMSGNVWEWCSDWFGNYRSEPQTNPTGPVSGTYRVRRGGSWHSIARRCYLSCCRSIYPGYSCNFLGFRPALDVE